MEIIKDNYGRNIDYMRISITDRCNLRCKYCMPDDINELPMSDILTFEEITALCRQAAKIGISNIKITGGEPLVRKGCSKLVSMIKKIEGIKRVTLTTNGTLLERYADSLYESGIDGINISLDTLDREEYKTITGYDKLSDVLKGIDAASKYNIPLKINTVLINNNIDIISIAKYNNIDVRFIEMMPVGYGKYFNTVSNSEVIKKLSGLIADDYKGNGPAIYYRLPGYKGRIGFISAVHSRFCGDCNKIRITSAGFVKGCLCYSDGKSVKEALRLKDYKLVREILIDVIKNKPLEHSFNNYNGITEKSIMSKIGG